MDATIGDIAFVARNDLRRITRHCSATGWNIEKFKGGVMPPHPAFFVRRRHYEQLGAYRTDYQIFADFKLLVRFLHNARLHYRTVPVMLLLMRSGEPATPAFANGCC